MASRKRGQLSVVMHAVADCPPAVAALRQQAPASMKELSEYDLLEYFRTQSYFTEDDVKFLVDLLDQYAPDSAAMKAVQKYAGGASAAKRANGTEAGIATGVAPADDPTMWGITLADLLDVREKAHQKARQLGENFADWTTTRVNTEIVVPLSQLRKTSYALYRSPKGLKASVFVTHAWGEPFGEFVTCIDEAFRDRPDPPVLWICTFALNQSDAATVSNQIGSSDESLAESPFARALKGASEMVVVRSASVDVYSRAWCVCELYFAHKWKFDTSGQIHVKGPNSHALETTSCLDAQCREKADRMRILHEIASHASNIDAIITRYRGFGP
eukprot:m.195157 g.195157  ORF g.195157 m.195157 type:complete len:330 (+) comp15224_c0_seq4:1932-2921(+)